MLKKQGKGYLEVGKTVNLSGAEQILVKSIYVALLHRLVDVDDVLQLLKEQIVNLGKLVNLIYGIAIVHSLTNHTKTLLDSLLEVAADCHYLTYRLHR